MLRSDFHFDLPAELIAQEPATARSSSRLLHLDANTGSLADRYFHELVDLLTPADLLVFNNTRVIPARLHGYKASGGKVEVLIERICTGQRVLAHVRASKSPKPGSLLSLGGTVEARVLGRQGELYELQFCDDRPVLAILEEYGEIPLPPYIGRAPTAADYARYQTVYAAQAGAVAAPTAGLHFDDTLLARLQQKGVAHTFVTLHVGAGTFQPMRAERLEDHVMHFEQVEVTAEVCKKIQMTKEQGGRVVAVGTTSVRSLETAAVSGTIQPFSGDTNLFIYPGYSFKIVDALVTNFHLPESTLLMLVCAFGGYQQVMQAYRHAIARRYRFFSYGDAMFITPQQPKNNFSQT